MKATIYLSLPNNPNPVDIARQAARACVSLNLVANVVPIFSSIPYREKPTKLEWGACVTLPSVKSNDSHTLLKLFGRLRNMFSELHCVWIDIDGEYYTGNEHEFLSDYHGCILEWPYYLNRHINIGHGKPFTCSEY